MADKSLFIAVLGDVHGHLTLAYRILKRWEQESSRSLDLILQVGDLGAFVPPFRLDDATKRFAEKDPDELGFADYYQGINDAAQIFGPDAEERFAISADLWFIKGNHEDFQFLHDSASGIAQDTPVTLDQNGAIHYLPSGRVFEFSRKGQSINIGTLGGISDRGKPGKDNISPFYTHGEVKSLLAHKSRIDIFLSHEPPKGAASVIHPKYEQSGSPDVAHVIRTRTPKLHFCGHYHENGQALAAPDNVQSYQLNAVNFLRSRELNPGCIAIVCWNNGSCEYVDLLDARWLNEYTKQTYRWI